MPADQPRGPNRAWKNQAAAPGTAAAGKRAWQKAPDAPTGPKRPWSRKSKLGLATFAVSAVIGAMILLFIIIKPPKPACLVLIGAPFEEDLRVPHNVYGWQGLKDMEALTNAGGATSWLPWSGSRPLRLQSGPGEYDHKHWMPRSFGEKTAVVFLALHGVSDTNGAYLVVNQPPNKLQRVPLKEVLKDFDSPELKEKNILLLLDATQVSAHWPSGLLHNDFARKLKELDSQIEKIPNLVVVCASDEDQRSWVSEEWRQTIFAHYVIEGLKGAADNPDTGGDSNSRVTALELFQYVKNRVEDWVSTRNAVQRPILLPLDAKEGPRRAERMELVQIPEPYREREWDQDSLKIPADLQPMWEQWARLRQQVPSPAVYTPQLWRRYQDTLLRYEQLLRAGDPTGKAESLRARLGDLKGRIEDARRFKEVSESVTNTFPMPAEVGRAGPWQQNAEFNQQFKDFWAPKPDKIHQENLAKLWATGQADGKGAAVNQNLLQVELSRLLLAEAARPAASRSDLDTAARLLGEVERLGNAKLRPAEAHYLVMLLRDLDADKKKQPPSEDLRRALEVCLLAENTAAAMDTEAQAAAAGRPGPGTPSHPYSECVVPWIKKAVGDADEIRRHGQDLLFGPAAQWVQARKDLEEASAAYKKIGKEAKVVRQALAKRDEILAALPYFGWWLAIGRVENANEPDALPIGELLGRVETLAHRLNDLVGPLKEADDRAKDLKALTRLTEELADEYEKLTEVFNRLSERPEDQIRFLSRFEAALAVPLLEPEPRMGLLKASRRLSAKLNKEFHPGAKSNRPGTPVATEAQEGAQRQGRMALAITGLVEPWLEFKDKARIIHPVNNLPLGKWRDDIAAAGEGIAARFQQMGEQIGTGLKKSVEEIDLKRATEEIQAPEYLCRIIPGAEALAEPAGFDAVEASRRLRFHDLLLWQAGRTLSDHWFKDSSNPEDTYYGPAGKAYVRDAMKVAEAGSEPELNNKRQAAAQTMDKTLVTKKIEAVGDSRQYVVSKDFSVTWKITAQEGVPLARGAPVFWLELEEKGAVKPAKDTYVGRKVLEPLPKDGVSYGLQEAGSGKEKEAKATLRGLFRGQPIQAETEVELLQPEIHVFTTPPPERAGILLRMAPDFTYGAVSIVLDCSGSMGYDLDWKKEGPIKIVLAKKALREVLKKLPKGTWLSVLAFGQVNPGNAAIPDWIRPPAVWDPDHPDKGLKVLTKYIDDLVIAQGASPIAEAIGKAKEEGFPAKNEYKGAKVILTLTDGDDNSFDFQNIGKDEQNERRAPAIRNYLKKLFNNGDIQVNLVCFAKKGTDDAAGAKKQFGIIEEVEPPGLFKIEEEPAELATTLEKMLRPRMQLQRAQDGKTPSNLPDGLLATPAWEKNLQWRRLDPAIYKGRLQNIYRQDLVLLPGQFLDIVLKPDDRDVRFERGLLYDFVKDKEGTTAKAPWHVKKGAWHASVPQNHFDQLKGKLKLRQLVAIEAEKTVRATARAETLLEQVSPQFVWMELKAKDPKSNMGARATFTWHNEFGYAAPTYRLSSEGWPAPDSEPVPPELQVWWSEFPPAESQKITHLARTRLADLEGQSVTLGENRVKLSSVKAEGKRPVTVAFDGDEGTPGLKPCLVVELEHVKGKPVWVRLDGPKAEGEEHLFYTASGRYKAIFWGVSNLEARDFYLTVISLEDFKRNDATNYAAFPLDAPDAHDSDERLPRIPLNSLE